MPLSHLLALLVGVATAASKEEKPPSPTWNRDIAPLLSRRCVECHQRDGIAPFELTSYREARKRRKEVSEVIANKRMPPWLPAESCAPLKHARALTESEVDTILQWYAVGAPQGPRAEAVTRAVEDRPVFDVSLQPSAPYVPRAAANSTEVRCFALEETAVRGRQVTGLQILPGSAQVKHATLYSVPAATVREPEKGQGPGWECAENVAVRHWVRVGMWSPGEEWSRYPTGTAIRLEAGTRLVLLVHYRGGSRDKPDLTRVRLRMTEELGTIPAALLLVQRDGFTLPPQARAREISTGVRLERGGTLWGVAPHLHARGKSIRVERNGECVLDIPEWDEAFWQFYFLTSLGVQLQPGDHIGVRCSFNNPTEVAIRSGEEPGEEACGALLYLTP